MVVAAIGLQHASDAWFSVDAWDYLTERSFASIADWTAPHGSHWPVIQFVALRGTYLAVGLDYWPWFPLLSTAALTGLGIVVYWSVIVRGAAPRIAVLAGLAAACLVVTLRPEHLGQTVGAASAVAVATTFGSSSKSARATCAIVGTAGVMANPLAVIACGSAVAVALLVPRLRTMRAWLAPGVPLIVYGLWRMSVGSGAYDTGIGLGDVGRLGAQMMEFLSQTGADVLAVPVSSWLVGLVVFLALGYLAWVAMRRADWAGVVLSMSVVGLAAAAALFRTDHDFFRWGAQVGVLLLAAAGPSITTRVGHLLLVALIGWAALVPLVGGRSEDAIAVDDQRRQVFSALTDLHAAGEPTAEGLPFVHTPLFGRLTDDGLGLLLERPYRTYPYTARAEQLARGSMRVRYWPAGGVEGAPLAGLDGCQAVAEGETSTWTVGPGGSVVVRTAQDAVVDWTYADGFGFGVGTSLGRAATGRGTLHLASGPATFSVSGTRPLSVCGGNR